tara:strand:+ start:470 stop:880 length:411 start_codon:yes stop_codon:yes gene_type:complete
MNGKFVSFMSDIEELLKHITVKDLGDSNRKYTYERNAVDHFAQGGYSVSLDKNRTSVVVLNKHSQWSGDFWSKSFEICKKLVRAGAISTFTACSRAMADKCKRSKVGLCSILDGSKKKNKKLRKTPSLKNRNNRNN